MPGKNLEKIYLEDTFYHIYNRGQNKQVVFNDDEDYRVFLNLFKRLLGVKTEVNINNRPYPNYHSEIELVAYCLMPNHYHLLILTKEDPKLLPELMRSAMTAYVMYFNKKNTRTGRLFEQHYRAVRITTDEQLWHISRYIHLNPLDIEKKYKDYDYSSIGYYLSNKSSDWVNHEEILDMFNEVNEPYDVFLEDYVGKRKELKQIKNELY